MRTTARPERTRRPSSQEDVPRSERPGAYKVGQRHWEATDSEVARRLEQAAPLSGREKRMMLSKALGIPRGRMPTVVNNRPVRANEKGRCCKADVPRNGRPGANRDGQGHWRAKDSEVAGRLESAARPSGEKKTVALAKASRTREGECERWSTIASPARKRRPGSQEPTRRGTRELADTKPARGPGQPNVPEGASRL